MSQVSVPSFADFDDYRQNQRVVVVIRWFLLAFWLFTINYREPITQTLALIDLMGAGLVVMNAVLTVRIVLGKPVSARRAVLLSVLDLTVITAGIGISDSRIGNTYFIMYYPALMGLSLTYPEPRVAFGLGSAAIAGYAAVAALLAPGLDFDERGERTLLMRISVMYAVIAASVLMYGNERQKRRSAVAAVRAESARALALQKKAQDAELATQEERHRLAREIHDGVAQSMYGLLLNLETAADEAEKDPRKASERLQKLVPVAKQALLETRNYMFDLKPMLVGERDFAALTQRQVKEFEDISNVKVNLTVDGELRDVPAQTALNCYRILRECLANVLKHAHASEVQVSLRFREGALALRVEDNGRGFDPVLAPGGYGLGNIQDRAAALGGSATVDAAPGRGTRVTVSLPVAVGA